MNNKKVTYYTNPYKKTTTAVITNCHMDAIKFFNDKIAPCTVKPLHINSQYHKRFIMNFEMNATLTSLAMDVYSA